MGALAVLTLLGGGLSSDGLHDGSLVSAVLVGSGGAALPSNESPGSGDSPGDGREGPLDIVVEVSSSHEHRGVGSGAVRVSSSDDLVLLGDVDELGPDVLHVDGSEVSDSEQEGGDVSVGDGVVGELFSAEGLTGQDIGSVLTGDLGALEECLGVGVFATHAGPVSLLSLTLVRDGLPHGAVDSVLLVVLLADGLLTLDDGGSHLGVTHLGNPLGLELEVGKSDGDGPVESVLGDVVDVLFPQGLGVLLFSGPGSVVQLRDDPSGSDLDSESVGNGLFSGSEDHLVCTAVCHFCVSCCCHCNHAPTMSSHSSLTLFQSYPARILSAIRGVWGAFSE